MNRSVDFVPFKKPVYTFTRTFYALRSQALVDIWPFVPFLMIKKDAKLEIIAVHHFQK